MSFEIYWDKLDHTVAKTVRERLNAQFAAMDKPDIIGDLEIADLDFGSVPPTVEILDITDPFPEFYWPDADNSHDASQPRPLSAKPTAKKHPNVAASAGTDPSCPVTPGTANRAHKPAPTWPAASVSTQNTTDNALSLPLGISQDYPPTAHSSEPLAAGSIRGTHHTQPHPTLPPRHGPGTLSPPMSSQETPMPAPRAQDTQIHLALAYKGDMSVTIKTSLRLNYPSLAFVELPVVLRMTGFDFAATAVIALLKDRINFCFLESEYESESLLSGLYVRSEIGDQSKHVLKNVEKIERFVVNQLRKLIDNDFIFPSYHSIELDDS
ncbi:Mitochondrial distribution and morphology protein 12 [Dimargaris xerosporica]|nr:Mitochondrial distribution and morphology protein 12 [Dimargaris xerosporica]